jgi:hypothetical protein
MQKKVLLIFWDGGNISSSPCGSAGRVHSLVLCAKTFFCPCYFQWTEVATNQHEELIVRSLLAARNAFLEIRLHMREMGVAAGIPVRPPL